MNKRFSKFMLTSASALALLAAYPSVASTAEVVGFDLPAITAEAATQGDAFIRVVRALPSVANITSADASSVRAARNLYNSLPNAEKANADVTRWVGYLADKEAALPVDHVRNFLLESRVLPNVAEINAMNAKEFAQAKVDLQAARASYAQLTNAEKANAEVARWAGYLTVKEDAFGVTFILAAKDLPSMDAIGKMDAKELVVVQEDIDSVRELYDALSDVAKADKEVARWIGYVDQKEEAVEAAAVVAIDSVKAINAKTIEVTFNKAVEDTSKASVELLRGTIKQNLAKTTWSEDKTSVQIELASKLQAADYTVNVTGAAEEVLTGTVKAEAEKVASIQILSDTAVVNSNTSPTSATVAYQVKNQYGEDITKSTTLTTNNSSTVVANPNTGVVTLTLGSTAKVGDKLPVTLIHTDSATSTTAVVTLSSAAAVSEVAINGIYNKDGKTLNEETNTATDKFYLLVDVKDQYGNAITNASAAQAGLIKSETNTSVATTAGTTPAVTLTALTIDGKTQLGLEVTLAVAAGESQVTLISTTTGKSSAYKINVAETTRTDVVTLSAPAIAVANEDILVPVSVLDKDGKEVTDVTVLNNATKGVKVTFGTTSPAPTFVKEKDGNIYIKVAKAQNKTDGTFPLVAQSSTYKVATSTIKVEKAAVPTTIRGLKEPLALAAGKTKTLAHTNLVVEDQYGREMKSTDVAAYLTGGKQIRVKDTNSTVVTIPASSVINGSTTVTVTAGAANGSEKLSFVIFDGTNELAASTAETTVRVTDGTEYAGYEIAPIGKVKAVLPKAFTVNGLLNVGKVALDGTASTGDYTATLSGGKISGSRAVDGAGTFTITTAELNTAADGSTPVDTEFTLKVTINATGQVFEQKFVASNANAVTEDIFFTSSAVATNHTGAFALTDAIVANRATIATSLKDALGATVNFATTDQYGGKAIVNATTAAPTITVVPEKVTDVTIADNGTANAKVTLKSGVTSANVTLTVKVGNATKELKVKVVTP